MILLLQLLVAHLIGDFILQPSEWVTAKDQNKLKAWQLYAHAALHAGLLLVLVGDVQFIRWALLLGGLHLIIDAAKLLLQTEKFRQYYFFGDQLLHLVSILWVFFVYQGSIELFAFTINDNTWLLMTLGIFLTQPAAIMMKIILAQWTPHANDDNAESLQHAGKYIGILERLFVFIFVITNNWEAVGFLITAKSVFRFGDLTTAKDRKLTEYILIGTLISFGVAILSGLCYLWYTG